MVAFRQDGPMCCDVVGSRWPSDTLHTPNPPIWVPRRIRGSYIGLPAVLGWNRLTSANPKKQDDEAADMGSRGQDEDGET